MERYKLGRLPATRPAALKDLSVYATGVLPTPPATREVPNTEYPMDGNDQYGDCLAPDTRLLTSDLRWVEAGSVQVGDTLIGFDETPSGNHRRLRSATVERVATLRKPCYELELGDGTTIVASADHQWLREVRPVGGHWLRTDQMVAGPKRASALQRWINPWTSNGVSPYDQGYLAGALDGEGCLARSGSGTLKAVQFTQRDNVMLAEVRRILGALGVQHGSQSHAGSSLSERGYESLRVGQRPQVVMLLGKIRPKRLLEGFTPDALGALRTQPVRLIRKTFVGTQSVTAIQTSTRTFIAEGFASHNCTMAGVAHLIAAWDDEVHELDTVPTSSEVIAQYLKLTGGEDTGLNEAEVLKTWQTEGLFGPDIQGDCVASKIAAYAPVDPKDLLQLHQAVAFYGGCYLGIECPESAQQQFDAGEPWTYVEGSPIEGGHCVVALGYGPHGGLHCATWGGIAVLEASFLAHYLQEAWCILSHQLVEARKDSLGIDLPSLEADLRLV